MTLYPTLSTLRKKRSTRKYRQVCGYAKRLSLNARMTRSFSEQWKRYPNSRAVVDLRLGNKTNTVLFPDGYDPYFWIRSASVLPIKGEKRDTLADHPDVDKIILSDGDPHKGVCLSLWSYRLASIERFKYLIEVNAPHELALFHQCNSRTFQMFEFWKPESTALIEIARRIARYMGIPLIVDLSVPYNLSTPVKLKDFVPFRPMVHVLGDFAGT